LVWFFHVWSGFEPHAAMLDLWHAVRDGGLSLLSVGEGGA
jgi:hypothetical protein